MSLDLLLQIAWVLHTSVVAALVVIGIYLIRTRNEL